MHLIDSSLNLFLSGLVLKTLLTQLACWILFAQQKNGNVSALFDSDVALVHSFVIANVKCLIALNPDEVLVNMRKLPDNENLIRLLGWGLVYVLPELNVHPDDVMKLFESIKSLVAEKMRRVLVIATLCSVLVCKFESMINGSHHHLLSTLTFISKTAALELYPSKDGLLDAVAEEIAHNISPLFVKNIINGLDASHIDSNPYASNSRDKSHDPHLELQK